MADASIIFFWLAFLLYAGAFVLALVYLFGRREATNVWSLWLTTAGLACQSASILLRGIDAGRVPVVGSYESLCMVAWSVALVYLVLELMTRVKAIGLYVLPVVLVLLAFAFAGYEAPRGLAPEMQSNIITLHLIVIYAAVGCLVVAGGGGIIYLVEESLLRRHKLLGLLGRLPSLATLRKLIYHATLAGLSFLTLGMLAGMVRAQVWGVPHWWSDPMVLFALSAWVVYVVLLWGAMRRDWSGMRLSWLATFGLLILLVIRFVIPHLASFHIWGS